MFVKNTNQNTTQSQQVLSRIDSERGSNAGAGVKTSARQYPEEEKGGFGFAAAMVEQAVKSSVSGAK
jgi:hypothetical protein